MTERDRFEATSTPTMTQALSRDEGGEPQDSVPDANSTTGTTPNEEFVGRVAADDGGGTRTRPVQRLERVRPVSRSTGRSSEHVP